MKLRRTFPNPIILILLVSMVLQFGCKNKQDGLVVEFPLVSEPIAITSGPQEHLFASYYGINSWSADQRYVTVLEHRSNIGYQQKMILQCLAWSIWKQINLFH